MDSATNYKKKKSLREGYIVDNSIFLCMTKNPFASRHQSLSSYVDGPARRYNPRVQMATTVARKLSFWLSRTLVLLNLIPERKRGTTDIQVYTKEVTRAGRHRRGEQQTGCQSTLYLPVDCGPRKEPWRVRTKLCTVTTGDKNMFRLLQNERSIGRAQGATRKRCLDDCKTRARNMWCVCTMRWK